MEGLWRCSCQGSESPAAKPLRDLNFSFIVKEYNEGAKQEVKWDIMITATLPLKQMRMPNKE